MSRALLFINTTEFHKLQLATISDQKVRSLEKSLEFNENFRTLELLEKFLAKQHLQFKNLEKIIVCSGPGSFTGIRVGVSMAQALGFGLKIPVVAIPKNRIPEDLQKLLTLKLPTKFHLHYGAKLKITKSKKETRKL